MNLLKKYFNRLRNERNINAFYKNCVLKRIFDDDEELAIITIAFNNLEMIKIQYSLIKKNIVDDYSYFVIDNSSLSKESKKLQNYCEKEKINYFKIPTNPGRGNPSESHGFAINWAVKNIVAKRKIRNFALLDHDIFPIKHYSILDKIKSQRFYGIKQEREEGWYLWPGFAFFSSSGLNYKNLDFTPMPGFDTGGKLWFVIFKEYNQKKINYATQILRYIKKSKNPQKDAYQIVDNSWIHLINGSNWANTLGMKEKTNYIKRLVI